MKPTFAATVFALGAAWLAPQTSVHASLAGHAKALASAQGVRAEVTVQPVPGAEEAATVLLGKEGRFRLESAGRLLVGDGGAATLLDKKANEFEKREAASPAAHLAKEPAAWAFLPFFEPDLAKLYKSGRKTGTRKVDGVACDEVQAVLADGTQAAFYVSTETGLAAGAQFVQDGKTWLVLVKKLEVLAEAPTASEFAFAAPAGAKEKSAAEAGGWASVAKVFQANCMPCHGANMAGGLDLRTYASAAKSRSVVPGDPAASPMVQYVRGTRNPRMPIGRAPLSEADTKAIEAWIAAGAKE